MLQGVNTRITVLRILTTYLARSKSRSSIHHISKKYTYSKKPTANYATYLSSTSFLQRLVTFKWAWSELVINYMYAQREITQRSDQCLFHCSCLFSVYLCISLVISLKTPSNDFLRHFICVESWIAWGAINKWNSKPPTKKIRVKLLEVRNNTKKIETENAHITLYNVLLNITNAIYRLYKSCLKKCSMCISLCSLIHYFYAFILKAAPISIFIM